MKTAALQKSVYDRLTGYSPVSSAVVGVYSDVPQPEEPEDDAAFPYVTIGPIIPAPWSTDDTPGVTALVDVGVWSRTHSRLAAREVADLVYQALNRYQLSIAGVNTVDCLFEGATDLMDPDGKTHHEVVTFRVTYDGT